MAMSNRLSTGPPPKSLFQPYPDLDFITYALGQHDIWWRGNCTDNAGVEVPVEQTIAEMRQGNERWTDLYEGLQRVCGWRYIGSRPRNPTY